MRSLVELCGVLMRLCRVWWSCAEFDGVVRSLVELCGALVRLCRELCGVLVELCGVLVELCGVLVELCGVLVGLCGVLVELCRNLYRFYVWVLTKSYGERGERGWVSRSRSQIY